MKQAQFQVGMYRQQKKSHLEWPDNTEVCKIYMYTYLSIHTHNIHTHIYIYVHVNIHIFIVCCFFTASSLLKNISKRLHVLINHI